MVILISVWIILLYRFSGIVSFCLLPDQFQNSVWVDSDKGELTFSTANMTGWDFQTKIGDTYEEWECFYTRTVGSKLYLIMVNEQNITLFGDNFTSYLCMELMAITPQSYYYYLLWAEEDKWMFERISTKPSSEIVSNPMKELCLSKENDTHVALYPETGEYHLLVKQGHELDAKQECPSTFFGEYHYTVTDKDTNSDYCGTGYEVWDVCTDNEQMTFNYTVCNTTIAYSDNGSVFCVFSLTSGSYTYHTLYNEDATVDISINTYRFTCMVSINSSDGSLNVSQTPGSCKKGQTPNEQPLFAYNRSHAGLNMRLTPRKLCPKQTNQTQKSKALSDEAVAGIVIGILLFTIILNVIIAICLKVKPLRHRRTSKRRTHSSAHVNANILTDDFNNERLESQTDKGESYVTSDVKTMTSSLKDESELGQSGVNKKDQIRPLQKDDENLTNLNMSDLNIIDNEKSDQNRNDINASVNETMTLEEDKNKLNSSGIGNKDYNGEDDNENKAVEDSIEILEGNCSWNKEKNKSDEIVVIRMTENENLRKNMPHLNSTDNIFSEYDVAMTYKKDHNIVLKSDVSVTVNCSENQNDMKNAFEYFRDDSGLNMRSEHKQKNKIDAKHKLNKSEGNLIVAVKGLNLKRTSSKISKISNEPLDWNFVYRSPYALSDELKQEIIDKKVKMQKKKVNLKKRKQQEREKRLQENMLAYEKWKQNKMKEETIRNKSVENISCKTRTTIYYPK